MPTYDYRCEANGQVVEIKHRMSEQVNTWGELCQRAGVATGDTPADSPVTRLITGGNVVRSGSVGESSAPACTTGSCCPSGFCGLN
ncbi:MAG: regulator [Gammaproteobacteria bacterium SG8_47]|nr:MAG: regulator [Gammaproteobacteria bacterium SG8_47]